MCNLPIVHLMSKEPYALCDEECDKRRDHILVVVYKLYLALYLFVIRILL